MADPDEERGLESIAARLGERMLTLGLRLATAESCTGGWIAKTVTDIPGSSAWFDSGFVTYSNAAKATLLGVAPAMLNHHGAVSEAVVTAMAEGALAQTQAQVALAISGIAGPGGGSADKPVGTVWFAWCLPGQQICTQRQWFEGDRHAVRRQAVWCAFHGLLERLPEP